MLNTRVIYHNLAAMSSVSRLQLRFFTKNITITGNATSPVEAVPQLACANALSKEFSLTVRRRLYNA